MDSTPNAQQRLLLQNAEWPHVVESSSHLTIQLYTFCTATCSSWNGLSSWPQWHHTLSGFCLNSLILFPFCGCLLHSVSKWRSSPGLEAGPFSFSTYVLSLGDLTVYRGLNNIFICFLLKPSSPHVWVCALAISLAWATLFHTAFPPRPMFACLPPSCHSDIISNVISSERTSLIIQFKVAAQSLFTTHHPILTFCTILNGFLIFCYLCLYFLSTPEGI